MRKIDKIAQEMFNGDIDKALNYVVNAGGYIDEYISELNKEELNIAYKHILEYAAKEAGGKDKLWKKYERTIDMEVLEVTEEELKTAKVNPYKAKLLKSLLILMLVGGVLTGLTIMGSQLNFDTESIGAITGVFSATQSFLIANNIYGYFKFRKLKKDANKKTSNMTDDIDTLDVEGNGRGL